MTPGSGGELCTIPGAQASARILKTTATAQEVGAPPGAGQELFSPARPGVMAASPRSPSGFPHPHTGPRTASNGNAVHFFPLDLVPSFTSSPELSPTHCPTRDLVPLSPQGAKLPCTPPSSPPLALLPKSPPSALPMGRPSPPSISILERLIKTCPVWLQLGMSLERANLILQRETPGIFLVRKNPALKKMVLSVRLCDQEGEPQVQDLLIKEEKSFVYLEGSVLVFDDIFKLIAFYCVSRDVLPFKLKLPKVIVQATKHEDMEMMSSLGSEFWGSSLNMYMEEEKACSGPAERALQGQIHNSPHPDEGGNRLWYVNPIFIEEHCSNLPIVRSQSLTTPGSSGPRYKRPPPLPPPPRSHYSEECPPPSTVLYCPTGLMEIEEKGSGSCGKASKLEQPLPRNPGPGVPVTSQPPGQRRVPFVPPRRKSSEKHLQEQIPREEAEGEENDLQKGGVKANFVPVANLVSIDDTNVTEKPSLGDMAPALTILAHTARPSNDTESPVTPGAVQTVKPVPPPRRKRQTLVAHMAAASPAEGDPSSNLTVMAAESSTPESSSTPTPVRRAGSGMDLHGLDMSCYSPEGRASHLDPDSYSTSSTEEEGDTPSSTVPAAKRSSTIMLDKAKQRLSMVNLSYIFKFMNVDRKLKKRIVELALDRESYIGNLVWDYRTYTMETMQKHSSSTEMLQEIRLMMTQLRSYLIQSAELKSLLEPLVPAEEKLEAIIEAALCKSVLKPLREAVYSRLRDIHTRDGSLDRLRENQQVLLNTTTTDLGVTTSIPEAAAMEKIQLKLGSLHKEYSPEKKITYLLKACKIIYESMSVSSPGKPYGADDFLPVLMYVLVRCSIANLVLDVEYMMELMDPALQLGEGSYYLTTTYGALEHIKNYDKLEVTSQFSIEIQDSIHRWERRRTLNKTQGSCATVQDFINVSFLEAGSNTKTLGAHPHTTAHDICDQCAKKFEVLEPESYGLFVLVEGFYQALTPDELPLSVKSSLHHTEPRKEYYFVYRPGNTGKEAVPPKPAIPPDSLI